MGGGWGGGPTRPCCSAKQTAAQPYDLWKGQHLKMGAVRNLETAYWSSDELNNPLPAQVSDDEGQNAPNSTLSPHLSAAF